LLFLNQEKEKQFLVEIKGGFNMNRIAQGLVSAAIAIVVPGGLIMLLLYYFTRNGKRFPFDIKFFNIWSAKQTTVRSIK
jgi:hypothetical protein